MLWSEVCRLHWKQLLVVLVVQCLLVVQSCVFAELPWFFKQTNIPILLRFDLTLLVTATTLVAPCMLLVVCQVMGVFDSQKNWILFHLKLVEPTDVLFVSPVLPS